MYEGSITELNEFESGVSARGADLELVGYDCETCNHDYATGAVPPSCNRERGAENKSGNSPRRVEHETHPPKRHTST